MTISKSLLAVAITILVVALLQYAVYAIVIGFVGLCVLTFLTWLFGDIPIYNPFAEKKSMR